MAALWKDGGPERTFMDLTSPVLSISASRVTLPVMNWRRASPGATARTDLMRRGGVMEPSLGDEAEMASADLESRTAECLEIGVSGAVWSRDATAPVAESVGDEGGAEESAEDVG